MDLRLLDVSGHHSHGRVSTNSPFFSRGTTKDSATEKLEMIAAGRDITNTFLHFAQWDISCQFRTHKKLGPSCSHLCFMNLEIPFRD